MYACRNDLETIRTMADQVRRREKNKKRELMEQRQEWRRHGELPPDAADEAPGAADESPAKKSVASRRLQQDLLADREARVASKAAAKAAREAATLISAQVMLAPGSVDDKDAAIREAGPSPAPRLIERKEFLHQPGEHFLSSCPFTDPVTGCQIFLVRDLELPKILNV